MQGRKIAFLSALIFLASIMPNAVRAETLCTYVISYPSGKMLQEDGNCNERHSPASSFKIPLALMGFETSLLKDPHTPTIEYRDEFQSNMDIQKKTTDPQIWLKDSIVWYSQKLTRDMGHASFASFVEKFDYGNMDVTRGPGQNIGLTHSWLSGSLKISPKEQAAFITKLLNCDLGVSTETCQKTIHIMPGFKAGEWSVFGKTGSFFLLDDKEESDRTKPGGWFVGWAEKDNQKIVFAEFVLFDQKMESYGGLIAREKFLKNIEHFNYAAE